MGKNVKMDQEGVWKNRGAFIRGGVFIREFTVFLIVQGKIEGGTESMLSSCLKRALNIAVVFLSKISLAPTPTFDNSRFIVDS